MGEIVMNSRPVNNTLEPEFGVSEEFGKDGPAFFII
jgi:hypothetical protein